MALALSVRVVRSSISLSAIVFLLANTLAGQSAKPPNQASPSQPTSPSTSPVAVLKASSHLVTVDVVVTDHHGAIVPGLTAKDFEVFEQVPGKKGQREQKISQFEFVTQAASAAAAAKQSPKIPTGVYTNLIPHRLPVPPTVLLVDGMNTDVDAGMQARRQMIKMLASIPPDTPVAVFLLGRQLRMLQSFTTDPKLLHDAAQKALSLDNAGMATTDARDDPDSLSQQTLEMFGTSGDESPAGQGVAQPSGPPGGAAAPSGPPGGELQMAAIERFERETFAATMDIRVQTTLDALRTLARHLSGYSGRKNLIWISASFPLTISPDATQQHNLSFEGNRNYAREVESVTNALADAKIAVYPVNPLGVQTQAYFDAAVRRSTVGYGNQQNTMKNSLNRENEVQFASQESMQSVAEQTGGKICVNNNDLADCVKTAVTEGSSYYEIAYYPDASDWHGEFHKITVKATRPGVQLSFRQGYYARTDDQNIKADDKSSNDPQLQEAACGDLLTSTSVLVVAEALPPDQPGQVKYFMAIDGKMLTYSTGGDGNHNMRLDLAVCTLDRGGKPLQYLQDHVQQQLGDKEFATTSARGVSHVVQFAPKAETVRVRLVVRDAASGRFGSVDIPYPPPVKSVSASK